MREFKFREKKDLKLLLNGKEYEIDIEDINFITNLDKIRYEADRIAENQNSNEDELVENIKEAMDFYCGSINEMLGEGAVLDIFGKRKVSFKDVTELFFHIMMELNEHSKESSIDVESILNQSTNSPAQLK